MKNYFCFHCQQQVSPRTIIKWRFCPHCLRRLTDDCNGFYMVCDYCGANLPPNTDNCIKCGHGFHGHPDIIPSLIPLSTKILAAISAALLLFLLLLIGIGVLYVAFYFFIIFFAAAVFYNLLKLLRSKM